LKEDRSIHIKGDNRGVAITGDGNTVNFPKHIIPKVLTKQVGLANDIDFVGRKEELQKVDELLNQNSMLLLLNGIGGIGKSTLASYYLNQKKDEFNYYGFIEVGEDIKSSFTSTLATALDLKPSKPDDMFDEAMNKLQNLKGNKLLVFDDLKDIANQKKEIDTILTLKNSGYKLLFTSRENHDNILQYCLDVMNLNDAKELFLGYYPTDEIEKVNKILEYLDYHTLFIELTAKTLKEKSHSLSLDTILEKFKNGEFTAIKRTRKEDFNTYLNQLFTKDSILMDEEILLFLKKLSVLPSVEISFEDLYKFLVCDNKESLEELLVELVNNGWLIQTKNGYKFHQILKEFILENHTPNFEEVENTINYFVKIILDIYSTQDVLDKKNYLIYLESLNLVTRKIKLKNEKIAYLIHSEGYINFILGNYRKVKKLYDESFNMRKDILNKDDIQLAISYNGQASIAEKNGNYNEALELYKKSLEKKKKNVWIEKIVIEYNNIGRMYQKLEQYDAALKFLRESLNIRKEIFGEDSESTAKAYNVLASLFQHMSKDKNGEYFKKAYEYYIKSLNIRKKVLQNNHPAIATTYNNIGTWFGDKEDWENAIKYFNLVVHEFTGKENEEIVAVSYFMLGQVYLVKGNYKDSLHYTQIALESFVNLVPSGHPYIKNCNKIKDVLEKYYEKSKSQN